MPAPRLPTHQSAALLCRQHSMPPRLVQIPGQTPRRTFIAALDKNGLHTGDTTHTRARTCARTAHAGCPPALPLHAGFPSALRSHIKPGAQRGKALPGQAGPSRQLARRPVSKGRCRHFTRPWAWRAPCLPSQPANLQHAHMCSEMPARLCGFWHLMLTKQGHGLLGCQIA